MHLADLISNKLQNEFLVHEPVLSSEKQILQPSNDASRLLGERRSFHNCVAAMCWLTSKDGILFLRRNSLTDEHQQQGKFIIENQTATYPHRHDFVELAYVARGMLRQQISGKDEVFYAGEFCLIDHDSMHVDYLSHDDSVVIFLSIEDAFFSETIQSNSNRTAHLDIFYRRLVLQRKEQFRYMRFVPEQGSEAQTHEILKRILAELWHTQSGSALIIQGYIERLLSILPTQYKFSLSKQEQNQMRKALFDEISEYLHKNFQHTGIEDLQAHFNYNADYFNRLIKQFAGMTYSKYLQSIRLEKALDLIKSTSQPIDSIARQVGYSNIGYFYKIFIEKYKKAPGTFRG